jgi:CBS domain-containing protein
VLEATGGYEVAAASKLQSNGFTVAVVNPRHIRDFARSVAKNERCVLTTPVRDFMTKDVVTISSEKSIEDCMELMTHNHFRHLPVVDHGILKGMISIGDVVKEVISMDENKINFLEYLMEERAFDQ